MSCCVEVPVNLEDFCLTTRCIIDESLSVKFDSPIRGIALICTVEEVNKLLAIRQEVSVGEVEAVIDYCCKR